jgi:hypothetical protein
MLIYNERTSDLFMGGQIMVLGLGGVRVERVGMRGRHLYQSICEI